MDAQDVSREIRSLTLRLVGDGFAADQNLPRVHSSNRGSVVWIDTGYEVSSLSGAMSYRDLYHETLQHRLYNVKFRDGGLIQFHYTFERRRLKKHRLAFMPSPDLEDLQNDPDLYLDDEEEFFADSIDPRSVASPLRFDLDYSAAAGLDHPACHLTLAGYSACRIPVSSPLSPSLFVDFVVRSFYNSASKSLSPPLRPTRLFDVCATAAERGVVYVEVPAR